MELWVFVSSTVDSDTAVCYSDSGRVSHWVFVSPSADSDIEIWCSASSKFLWSSGSLSVLQLSETPRFWCPVSGRVSMKLWVFVSS